MSTGKVLVGVLSGLAAGALLGVLFAPDKGSETRRKISKKSSDSLEGLKEKINEMMNSLTDKYDDAKDSVSSVYENGKQKAEDFKKDSNTVRI